MRLIGILITVLILAFMFSLLFKRLYSPTPNSSGLDTSIPGVNRQVESLQDTTKKYNDTLKSQQNLLK
jgi:hypothetical protein